LEAQDGNLLIVAAQDRNLTLVTSGRGAIVVNGLDIKETLRGPASYAFSNSPDLQRDVQRLLAQQASFSRRLAACEAQFNKSVSCMSYLFLAVHDDCCDLNTSPILGGISF